MAEEVGVETVEEVSIIEGEDEVLVLTLELVKERRVHGRNMRKAEWCEVNGGGVVIGVSKHFSLEFIVVLIGDSGGVVIGEVGGAPDV
ncbi:hypothetical protein Tco_0893798 [Tanacetum coccineum]|uniref:Uncharacterized protein n=1 Tax=Tanacetum coccineum TaxID=301880 RepID=A0ABQ5C9Z0_9ASTR